MGAKPIFITLEGIDGCGKSTQIKLLYKAFLKLGINTIVTKEPGGTRIGNALSAILLRNKKSSMDSWCELFLFQAARREHVVSCIEPSLCKGINVICDRYTDASLAYQGYGSGLDLKLISKLNSLSSKKISPNLTFLLDISVAAAMKRIKLKTKDRIEARNYAFFSKVRKGYLELAKSESRRIVVLDGLESPEKIHNRIMASLVFKKLIPKPNL